MNLKSRGFNHLARTGIDDRLARTGLVDRLARTGLYDHHNRTGIDNRLVRTGLTTPWTWFWTRPSFDHSLDLRRFFESNSHAIYPLQLLYEAQCNLDRSANHHFSRHQRLDGLPDWLSYASSEPLWLDMLPAFCSESSSEPIGLSVLSALRLLLTTRATLSRRWQPIPPLSFLSNVFVQIWRAIQIDNFRGFNSIFPLQGRFLKPRSEAHCQAQQLVQSRAPCSLALFPPFAHFALFPLFVVLLVPNSIYQPL